MMQTPEDRGAYDSGSGWRLTWGQVSGAVRRLHPKAKFGDVVHAMDVSRGSGVKVIGVPPKDTPGSKP